MQSQQQKFYELLKTFHTAMLVTHMDNGQLRARPMAIAHIDETCRMWFFTTRDCSKSHEVQIDKRVHVVCQCDRSAYLSMSGSADLIQQAETIKKMWQEPFRVWFPKGPEDPELTLIAVTPTDGEYWDNTGLNRVKYLYEAAKAYIAGETPQIQEGELHGVVRLN